jgi:cell division protein ZapA
MLRTRGVTGGITRGNVSRAPTKCDKLQHVVKRSVQVEIAGQTLSIKSEEAPEYVRHLADYVDAHLRELSAHGRATFSLQRMALLVAMEIADELFREKDLYERYRRRVESRLDALKVALDEHETRLQAL